jgi:hypothetical protein
MLIRHREFCLAVPLLALLLSGCTATQSPVAVATDAVTSFSQAEPGAQFPAGWQRWIISPVKRPTRYTLVRDDNSQQVVLHATAVGAATGLRQTLDVDPSVWPVVTWQWRLRGLIADADATDHRLEDSPARLLLFFDGDARSLPARELMLMETARVLTGQIPPFATLIYTWENKLPVGTVVDNAHTGQVKMVVAGSGLEPLDHWQHFERNYVTDYTRAFGEPPRRLIGIGVLTDSDNTGQRIEAFYGDIALKPHANR